MMLACNHGVGEVGIRSAMWREQDVANAVRPIDGVYLKDVLKVPQFAGSAADAERPIVAVNGNTGQS